MTQRKVRSISQTAIAPAAAGDYQQAIDLWSRIFLTTSRTDEASQRIENAKVKRREIDAEWRRSSPQANRHGRDNAAARATIQ